MARFCCLGGEIDDPSYFKCSLIIDIVLLALISIFNIVHLVIFYEATVAIFLALNLLFLSLSIFMLVWFASHKEVQRYENFQYANSREAWNIVSLLTTVYLICITCFRVFGYLDKKELTAIFVFYVIYAIFVVFDLLINIEVKRIVFSDQSSTDGANYLESQNKEEKMKKKSGHENAERMRFSGSKASGILNSYGRLNEDNYHINESVEFINTTGNAGPALKNSNQINSLQIQQENTHVGNSDTIAFEGHSEIFGNES